MKGKVKRVEKRKIEKGMRMHDSFSYVTYAKMTFLKINYHWSSFFPFIIKQ